MRRTLPALLIVVFALLACGDEPAPAPPVPSPPPAPAAGTVAALLADWTPPDDVSARVEAWTNADAVHTTLKDMPGAENVPLIRAALRLPDGPVARIAARHVDADHYDRNERLRATRLIIAAVARGESNSLWNLLETASAADLRTELLPRLRTMPVERLGDNQLGGFHKLMRADDLPAVCEWFLTADPPLPETIAGDIEIAAWHTTKHRREVARVILRGRPVPRDDGEGLPESLVAVLGLVFPREGDPVVDVGRYDGWALQWLADEVPVSADAAVLLSIARDHPHPIVLWALRHVASDTRVKATLAHHDQPAGYAALASAGDRDALTHLRYAAREDDEAMAFLLLVDPTAAREELFEQLVDDETADDAVRDITDILEDIRYVLCLDLPAATLDPLAERLLASDVAPEVLLALAPVLRRLWSEDCADAILARLDPKRMPHPDRDDELPVGDLEFALLELARRDACVDLLRGWARGDDEASREFALPLLASLGDDASGDLIAEWFRDHVDDEPWPPLGRVEHPQVRALLTDLAATDDDVGRAALHTLAELDGLPPHVYFPSVSLSTEGLARVRGLVLAGRGIDAFVLQYELDPEWYVDHAGDTDDPRVTAHVRERATLRGEDEYLSAMQELAAQGDANARAIVLAAVRDGDYRWTEEIRPRAWMLDNGVESLLPWADLAESNCCLAVNGEFPVFRRAGATLGHWPEPGWSGHGHGDPPALRMRTWFAEWGPDLVRSDLLSDEDGPQWAPRPRRSGR